MLFRSHQAEEAASVALSRAGEATVLVGGDFNDLQGSSTLKAMEARGFRDTVGALRSDQIDHLFLHRGAALQVQEAAVVFDGKRGNWVSDHPGYLVSLMPADVDPVVLTSLTTDLEVGWGHRLTVRGDGVPLSWVQG